MRPVERLALSRACVLAVAACLFVSVVAHAQSSATVMVYVFRDHFEVDGQRFSSVDELRQIPRDRSIGYSIRECGADDRLRELLTFLGERADGRPLNVLRERFPLQCEGGQ
jgi:hypothetical protein